MGFNSAFKGLTYPEPLGPPRPVAGYLYFTFAVRSTAQVRILYCISVYMLQFIEVIVFWVYTIQPRIKVIGLMFYLASLKLNLNQIFQLIFCVCLRFLLSQLKIYALVVR